MVCCLPGGRVIWVTWKGSTSAPCRLSTSVPEGSVLGPLVFSHYIHSIVEIISSHGFSYHCYVEDTLLILSFLISHSHVLNACQETWQHLIMATDLLKINPSKTEQCYIPGGASSYKDFAIYLNTLKYLSTCHCASLG